MTSVQSTTSREAIKSDDASPTPRSLVITQTLAIFVDAYRELNARRLFWISMVISGLVVAAFGAVGINDQGIEVFWKTFPSTMFNTLLIDRATVYKLMFEQLGINWWLTLIANVLALVSTANIFPDFLSGGSIDLYLSKPLGRLRLFLTKYLTGLVFVALQVTVFCIGSFFVIGLRGGVWEPSLFVAVPLVVLFFSYLFGLMVLLGVLTRSTLAALLLTIIFWAATATVHYFELNMLKLSIGTQLEVEFYDHQIATMQSQIKQLTETGAKAPVASSTQPVTFADRQLQIDQGSVAQSVHDRDEITDSFALWRRLAFAVEYPFPKTSETYGLIGRVLQRRMHIPSQEEVDEEPQRPRRGPFRSFQMRQRADGLAEEQMRARSPFYILGTSLAFEAAVVGLAGWLFCRRDF